MAEAQTTGTKKYKMPRQQRIRIDAMKVFRDASKGIKGDGAKKTHVISLNELPLGEGFRMADMMDEEEENLRDFDKLRMIVPQMASCTGNKTFAMRVLTRMCEVGGSNMWLRREIFVGVVSALEREDQDKYLDDEQLCASMLKLFGVSKKKVGVEMTREQDYSNLISLFGDCGYIAEQTEKYCTLKLGTLRSIGLGRGVMIGGIKEFGVMYYSNGGLTYGIKIDNPTQVVFGKQLSRPASAAVNHAGKMIVDIIGSIAKSRDDGRDGGSEDGKRLVFIRTSFAAPGIAIGEKDTIPIEIGSTLKALGKMFVSEEGKGRSLVIGNGVLKKILTLINEAERMDVRSVFEFLMIALKQVTENKNKSIKLSGKEESTSAVLLNQGNEFVSITSTIAGQALMRILNMDARQYVQKQYAQQSASSSNKQEDSESSGDDTDESSSDGESDHEDTDEGTADEFENGKLIEDEDEENNSDEERKDANGSENESESEETTLITEDTQIEETLLVASDDEGKDETIEPEPEIIAPKKKQNKKESGKDKTKKRGKSDKRKSRKTNSVREDA